MRTAITLGFRHGGTPVEVVSLPTVPFVSQKTAFKLLRKSQTHPDFERVEIWDSGGGRMKSARFTKPPTPQPTPAPEPPKYHNQDAPPPRSRPNR